MRLPHRNTRSLPVSVLILLSLSLAAHAQTGQLACTPSTVNFRNVQLGQTQTQVLFLNNSGGTTVTVSGINVTNSAFTVSGASLPITVASGQSVAINLTFAPKSSTWFGGYVTFSNNTSTPNLRIFVQGDGVSVEPIAAQPTGVSFGQVAVGSSATRSVVLTSTVSYNQTLQSIQPAGTGFSVTGPSTPFTLAARQSVTVNVTFAPNAPGTVSGNLAVSGPYFNIPLSATGTTSAPVGQLSVTPSTLNMGSTVVGSSVTASGTLSSSGASVSISSATTSNAAFKVTGLSLPATIAPGQSLPFTVTFSPSATGSATGTLSFTSNAQTPTVTESLSGTGTAPVGQLAVSPTSLSFGSVTVGSSGTASGTLSASGASVTITSDSSSNAAFKVSGLSLPATIAAGQSLPFTVKFSPTAAGAASGSLSFASNAQTPTTTESLSGTGTAPVGQLAVNPTSLSFGSVTVGSSGSASGTLSASGASITISSDSVSNTSFKVSGLSLPITVPAGQSVPFTVTFSPIAAGSATGTLSFTSNAQTPTVTETLSGTGTTQAGQLTVSPTTLSFGNVDVGSSATQACTVSASGAAVTLNSASMSNAQFSLSGASFPMTLSAGQTTQIFVIFSPTASGTDSGTLTLNSNASNAVVSEPLSGVGVTPQHTVTLSWSASTSSVAGYNIYRGTSPGSYTKINSTLDANTSYTDNTVVSGVTYYYAATAVTSGGQESAYSTPVQVSIP